MFASAQGNRFKAVKKVVILRKQAASVCFCGTKETSPPYTDGSIGQKF